MTAKTPIRTVFNESGTATGLAEFQTGEFVPVEHGGTGAVTHTANAILLGNTTSALQSSLIGISGTTLSSTDSSLITIDEALTVTGNLNVSGTITGTISGATTSGNIQVGVTGNNEIDTSSGNLTIDSAGGTVTVDDNLTISGNLTVNGTTTTVNSTTVDVVNSFRFEGSTSDEYETNLTVVDPTADRTITLPNATGTVSLLDNTETLTNKTIDASNNTLSNIGDSSLSSGIDALKIADGSISNTEFQYLNGVSSNIQSQLDGKASSAFAIAQAVALG